MRRDRVRSAAAAFAAAVVAFVLAASPAAGQTFANWTQYLFLPGHTSQNAAATTITSGNAANLSLAWKFWPKAPAGLGGFYSSPTVYNGVVYIGARNAPSTRSTRAPGR